MATATIVRLPRGSAIDGLEFNAPLRQAISPEAAYKRGADRRRQALTAPDDYAWIAQACLFEAEFLWDTVEIKLPA